MIIQQCYNCSKKGKNIYCNNCNKTADYFDIYSYNSSNRFDKDRMIGRIKAYTWLDVLEYIKNNFFGGSSKSSLDTNCEKDFAFIEERTAEDTAEDTAPNRRSKKIEKNKVGYKAYLIKEEKFFKSTYKVRKFRDLTSVTNNEDF